MKQKIVKLIKSPRVVIKIPGYFLRKLKAGLFILSNVKNLKMPIKNSVNFMAKIGLDVLLFPIYFLLAFIARYQNKKIDIGIGPEPMINSIYHKKALMMQGYSVETFVFYTTFISSDFDLIIGDRIKKHTDFRMVFAYFYLFIRAVFRYKCIYIYFNGGPIGVSHRFHKFNRLIWKFESQLFKISKTKTIVLPYGGDVIDLRMCTNLKFKHALIMDYPYYKGINQRANRNIKNWISNADHIVGGCDWIDYLYHWDSLMLSHFAIDLEKWKPSIPKEEKADSPIKIFHAPNHKTIKGTNHFIKAIDELKKEGLNVELKIVQQKHNDEIMREIREADIIADQLVIGWYAFFAIEAMALGKPVLCFLRDDLLSLYEHAKLVKKEEIPIVSCTFKDVKSKIKELVLNREKLNEIGRKSREYVEKYHSCEFIGSQFAQINKKLNILPSLANQ